MITIYPQNAQDFSTNGLGTLTPIRCVAAADDGHYTELEIMQPIDHTNRWALLVRDAIIKAPCPVRESPEYEEVAQAPASETVTVERPVYRVRVNSHLRLRSGPSTNYKILDAYENGVKVVKIGQDGSWYKVIVQKGGKEGWMYSQYLDYVETITETVTREQPVKANVIEYRPARNQLWRIYSVEPDTVRGVVVAKAQHIFYDLQYNVVGEDYAPENVAAGTILTNVWNKLAVTPEHALRIPYALTDKIDGGDYGFKNPIECLLDKDIGILNQAGARLALDNFDVWVLPGETRDSGVTIRRGKNLKGVKATEDGSSIVTRIIPRGKDKDGDPLYITDGTGPGSNGVDSPQHFNDYPGPRIKMIDYDVKVVSKDADGEKTFSSNGAARTKLKALAAQDFADGADLPQYTLKVDFVLLENTAEYAEYAGLQSVFLGDTVTVIDSLIGLSVKVEAVGFKFDCLRGQYESLTLGDVDELTQKVYSYQLPTGGVSGTKIAKNSANGAILRDMSVQYAKIETAAITQLAADAITAVTARINTIEAQEVSAQDLYAAFAHLMSVAAANITAQGIQTDDLAAQMAQIAVLSAGVATFNRGTIEHLVANALNLTGSGTAEDVFIHNLRVAYAQMADAAIGNLCVKAKDGNYYTIDVNADGTVTGTLTTVTQDEIEAGQTSGGRVILGTDITAANLSTANLLGTYALINRIDAARIDVDQLVARQAFINKLNTNLITNNSIIRMEITDAVDGLEIGGRNLIIYTLHPDPSTAAKRPRLVGQQANTGGRGTSTAVEHGLRFTMDSSTGQVYIYFGRSANSSTDMNGLVAGQTYTFSADCGWKALSSETGKADTTTYTMRFLFRAKHSGDSSFSSIVTKDFAEIKQADKGTVMAARVEGTFTVPDDAVATYIGVNCSKNTASHYADGDYIELKNIKCEIGIKATDWTPAPEDVDAATAAAQSTADDAASAASAAQGTADSAVTAAATAQSAADAAQASVDGLPYEGRNMLLHTAEPGEDDVVMQRATLSDGVLTITPTTSAAYFKYKSSLTLADVRGQRMTLSLYAREIASGSYGGDKQVYMYFGLQDASRESNIFAAANDAYSRLYADNLGAGWQRYTYTATIPDDLTLGKTSILTDEGADALVLAVQVGRAAKTCPIEVINMKLEYGEKATAWKIAPEDVDANTAAAHAAADAAQATADDANATAQNVRAWMKFSETGLEQGRSGSTYTTLIDNSGFHILQLGEKISSFAKRQLAVEEIRIGRVNVSATRCVMREAGDGGMIITREGLT